MSQNTSLIFRYVIVGLSVAGIYIIALAALQSVDAAPPAVNSAMAFALAVTFQYIAQGAFTFRKPLKDKSQIARFATTVAMGLCISSIIVGYLGPKAGLSAFYSSLVVVVLLPGFNLVLFMLWVFVDKKSGGYE